MPHLVAGHTHAQAQSDWLVVVDLKPGRWTISLTVLDDRGRRNAPAHLQLTVVPSAPKADKSRQFTRWLRTVLARRPGR